MRGGRAEFADAASILQEFVTRVPGQVQALLKLVEVCVDGGLESTMYEAQAQLADAYLASAQAAEARVIAEDLVATRAVGGGAHRTFRRRCVMLQVPDADTVIAERLSGRRLHRDRPFHRIRRPGTAATPPWPKRPAEPDRGDPPPDAAPAAGAAERQRPRRRRSPTASRHVESRFDELLGELQGPESTPPAEATAAPAGEPRRRLQGMRKDPRKGAADQSAQHMTLARTYLKWAWLDEATAALEVGRASRRATGSKRAACWAACTRNAAMSRRRSSGSSARRRRRPPTRTKAARCSTISAWCCEETGERARALAVFLELQADAGELPRRAQRADRLAGCRPEADHLLLDPPPVRRLLPGSWADPDRRAVVRRSGTATSSRARLPSLGWSWRVPSCAAPSPASAWSRRWPAWPTSAELRSRRVGATSPAPPTAAADSPMVAGALPPSLLVHATPRRSRERTALLELARTPPRAGVDLIQIRERHLDDRSLVALRAQPRRRHTGTGRRWWSTIGPISRSQRAPQACICMSDSHPRPSRASHRSGGVSCRTLRAFGEDEAMAAEEAGGVRLPDFRHRLSVRQQARRPSDCRTGGAWPRLRRASACRCSRSAA